MKKMATTRIEMLEDLQEEVEQCKIIYNEKFTMMQDDFELVITKNKLVGQVRRFARLLDLTNWNFSCFKDIYQYEEDLDIIADEIKMQYIYECEKREEIKLSLLLEIVKIEAEKEKNEEAIEALEEITPGEIRADNGNKFKRILKKLMPAVGEGVLSVLETTVKATSEGVTKGIINYH